MENCFRVFDQQIENEDDKKSNVGLIIQSIKRTVYALRSEEEIRLHIQNNQVALMDYKRFEKLYEQCDEVLFFLETHFLKYLDDNFPLSDIGIKELLKMSFGDEFKKNLVNAIDSRVLKIIEPLCSIHHLGTISIYFAKYLRNFYTQWVTHPPNEEEKSILNFLIIYNFNTPALLNYLAVRIVEVISNETDPKGQLEVLNRQLDSLLRIPNSQSMAFFKDFPSMREMFEEWLRNEIKLCRKRIKSYNPNQLPLFSKDTKIETSLSVAQTAYFVKLLYNAGIMTNKVQGDILQVISKTMRSKRTEEISYDSLHNKYYNVEDKTKQSLKLILQDLIKRIN